MALRSAEQVLQQTDKNNANKISTGSNSTNEGSSNNSITSSSGKKKHTVLEYEEAVVEVDTDNKLPDYEAQALIDPLVQQYATRYCVGVIHVNNSFTNPSCSILLFCCLGVIYISVIVLSPIHR